MSIFSTIFGTGRNQQAELREELADSLQALLSEIDWAEGTIHPMRIPEFFNTLIQELNQIPKNQRKAGLEITETLWNMTKLNPGAGWLRGKSLPLTAENIFIAPPQNPKGEKRPLDWRSVQDIRDNPGIPSDQYGYIENGPLLTDEEFYLQRLQTHINNIICLVRSISEENRSSRP